MLLTLLDIAKLNGRDMEVGLIEENLKYAPEVAKVPTRIIKGTAYHATIRTSLPEGGGFRSANEGVTAGKSTFKKQLVECFLYSKLLKADTSVLNAGEDDSEESLKTLESSGGLKSAFDYLGEQFYYGVGFDAKGFPGIRSMSNPELELDATGNTADTASSVYGVKFGVQNVHFIFGNKKALHFQEWWKQLANDGTGKEYAALCSNLDVWMGLANGSKYSVGRLKNLTAQDGKGVTDAKLEELKSKYPVGEKPDFWMMNRRSLFQLQKSRSTVINATGAKSKTGEEVFAPEPVSAAGIPIIVTESIRDTDPVE